MALPHPSVPSSRLVLVPVPVLLIIVMRCCCFLPFPQPLPLERDLLFFTVATVFVVVAEPTPHLTASVVLLCIFSRWGGDGQT